MSDFSLILLAAGGSTRMGRPKQLLICDGRSLLRRAAQTAVESGCGPIIVVLGDGPDRMREELVDLNVSVIVNPNWPIGMGSSILAGMQRVSETSRGVIVTLCDQPFVTADVLRELIETHTATGAPVCAAAYENTVGPPCLFAASEFARLRAMPADHGAKKLILATANMSIIPFPGGATDIDTPDDYMGLQRDGGQSE